MGYDWLCHINNYEVAFHQRSSGNPFPIHQQVSSPLSETDPAANWRGLGDVRSVSQFHGQVFLENSPKRSQKSWFTRSLPASLFRSPWMRNWSEFPWPAAVPSVLVRQLVQLPEDCWPAAEIKTTVGFEMSILLPVSFGEWRGLIDLRMSNCSFWETCKCIIDERQIKVECLSRNKHMKYCQTGKKNNWNLTKHVSAVRIRIPVWNDLTRDSCLDSITYLLNKIVWQNQLVPLHIDRFRFHFWWWHRYLVITPVC